MLGKAKLKFFSRNDKSARANLISTAFLVCKLADFSLSKSVRNQKLQNDSPGKQLQTHKHFFSLTVGIILLLSLWLNLDLE